MSKSSRHPRVKLSKLRDIGWSLWDPIGLLPSNVRWDDEQCENYADEYDTYLVRAAGMLWKGVSQDEVVAYLEDVEANYMGLGNSTTSRDRSKAVVAAIAADSSIWTLPDDQGRFRATTNHSESD